MADTRSAPTASAASVADFLRLLLEPARPMLYAYLASAQANDVEIADFLAAFRNDDFETMRQFDWLDGNADGFTAYVVTVDCEIESILVYEPAGMWQRPCLKERRALGEHGASRVSNPPLVWKPI